MGKLDISKTLDFARLTMGDLGTLVSDFAGRDPNEWDILESSYGHDQNIALFHVFKSKTDFQAAVSSVTDHLGRRKVKYRYPYVDGQTTDDMGRQPFQFDFDILFFGPNYFKAFQALIQEFENPTPGILTHPVLGSVKCVVESWTVTHSSEKRRALMMKACFVEHNFDVDISRTFSTSTTKSLIAQALQTFQKVESAIAHVQGAVGFARTVIAHAKQLLTDYKTAYAQTLTNINVNYNKGTSTDIPSVLPVQLGGTRDSQGNLISTDFPISTSPQDPFLPIPINSALSSALANQQIQNEVGALRDNLNEVIAQLIAMDPLEFFDDIESLRQTAVDIQNAFEKGQASSKHRIIQYTTPRLMSIREIAFANGLSVNEVENIDILNHELDSVNFIDAGTVVQIAI